MVYGSLTWMYVPDAHLLKLQRLQNRVLGAGGNFDRRKPVQTARGFQNYLRVRLHK
jgi:hypothetical protein